MISFLPFPYLPPPVHGVPDVIYLHYMYDKNDQYDTGDKTGYIRYKFSYVNISDLLL